MNFYIEKVLERDIDLLVINCFISNDRIKKYFLNKINRDNYEIKSIRHSYIDLEDGESDITVILENNDKKIGLLIEDKIDAPAMKNQHDRYILRGNKGLENKLYDEYFIFLIAPLNYINTNYEAKKYENKISYEELIELLEENIYAKTLLTKAIEEKKNGYTVIENKNVTNFWLNYYKFIKENYTSLKINEKIGPRGSKASWAEFYTDYPNVKIIHKINKGFIDLTFYKLGDYIEIFDRYVNNILDDEFIIVKTGKSLAIRSNINTINLKNDFQNYVNDLHDAMSKITKLYEIVNKINVLLLYKETIES